MQKPYIGITGFVSRHEVDHVLGQWERIGNPDRVLSVGVLLCSQTLAHRRNHWPKRYPDVEKFAEIFFPHPQAINVVHYYSSIPDTLCQQLVHLITHVGAIDGFQFNFPWPSVAELSSFRRMCEKLKHFRLILTVGPQALRMIDYSPEEFARRTKEYCGIIDDILLDPSQGQGRIFNQTEILKYLAVLERHQDSISFGVAGGLCPETIYLLEPIVERFPRISIDAESQLRNPEDYLHLDRTVEYVCRANQILHEKRC